MKEKNGYTWNVGCVFLLKGSIRNSDFGKGEKRKQFVLK